MNQYIYIFNNPSKSKFSSGAFSSKALADQWIKKYKLSGILSQYPIDIGVYDWAISKKFFVASVERDNHPDFIGSFSSASLEHYHYENGICEDNE